MERSKTFPSIPLSLYPSISISVASLGLISGPGSTADVTITAVAVPGLDKFRVDLWLTQEPLTVVALVREGGKLQELLAKALACGPIIQRKDVPGHGLWFRL